MSYEILCDRSDCKYNDGDGIFCLSEKIVLKDTELITSRISSYKFFDDKPILVCTEYKIKE